VRVCYDAEFLEDGRVIDLISIALVADDGREYYAVSRDATRGRLARRIRRNEWLMANVVPALPQPAGDARNSTPRRWLFNYADPRVKPRHQIAAEVTAFILDTPPPRQLWADYGAYDHVLLAQLSGRMTDLPAGVPMWTHDLRQEAEALGYPDPPPMPRRAAAHNALDDAREVAWRLRWLDQRRRPSRP